MKKINLKVVKIDKNKKLFNYEKKILIKELTLDLKLGYYEFEKENPQKVKFSLEIDYEDKKPTSDKDIKSIVNYGQVVKLIKKLTKNKIYPKGRSTMGLPGTRAQKGKKKWKQIK